MANFMDPRLPERFWRKVIPEPMGGCWLFVSSVATAGYGTIWHGGEFWTAHRLAYTALVGPVLEGLTIDHLCRVRCCCNPAHLEPVTNQVNVQRAYDLRTHCPQGHEYTLENLRKSVHGRKCATCHRAWERERGRAKRRAA